MSPENLKIFLSKKFDLLLFMDLAVLLQKHRTVFDVFKSIHRPAFDPKHRIVFYTSYEPEQDLIDHIQRAAARIDISNFFILIVCPYDIKKKLLTSCLTFGDPNVTMQSLIMPVDGSLPIDHSLIAKTNTLCPLPFAMVLISQTGQVKPCCKFKSSVGECGQQNINEIFHGEKIEGVRQRMLRGETLSDCKLCWETEKSGSKSLRLQALDKYGDALDQYWLDDVQIRDISYSPSTICNFKCRICSSFSSSSIAAEDIKFSTDARETAQLKTSLKKLTLDTSSINDQILHCESLEYLHLMGGEPFLWPGLRFLIDDLIGSGRSHNIHLEFNTNGSVYDDDLMHEIIDKFASLEILLSIDNIGKRFEIERGGSWHKIKRNIEQFASLNKNNTKIKIVPTVNIQNILYLDSVLDFAQSLGLEIVWWYLETPACLCIDYVTESAKKLIINKYRDSAIEEIQKIVCRLQQSPMSDGQSFVEYVKKFDLRRKQNFQITHKEIFEAMGGC